MSFTTTLYEGDSIIHTEFRAAAVVNSGVAGATREAPTALESAELGTAELDCAACAARIFEQAPGLALIKGWTILIDVVWNALRSVGLWIEEKSREAHYRRVESYLAQSSNHADLERRLRDIGRGNRLNWIDCGSR